MSHRPLSRDDVRFLRMGLSLARRAMGRVEPNPMVGAVVVGGGGEGRVVGKGHHQRFGGPHAEVFALREAGSRARGATLYVTLEPCCHWGKTPPCTDAIVAGGIGRVVIAMIDPFSRVHGRGVSILRKHGLQVDIAGMAAGDEEGARVAGEARELNAPFITRLTLGRPYVIAKWAQSVDGCIATASGESRWISSPPSREFVHMLRGRVDGVVVGIGTALADDPLLTARPQGKGAMRRLATRIVVDSECRLLPSCKLVQTVADAPVMVAHVAELGAAAARRCRLLDKRGVMMVGLPADRAGRVRIDLLLKHLGKLEYTNVLVEGGAEMLGSLFRAELVDEAHVFVAPMVIGGGHARHAVAGPDLAKLSEARRLRIKSITRSGDDAHLVLRRAERD